MTRPRATARAFVVGVASAGVSSASAAEVAAAARAVLDAQEPHGLFTLLLRRLDGAWRIVHDHTSSGE